MNPLRNALKDYLDMRRALGFELNRQGRSLERFIEFLEREGSSRITTELALRWATSSSHAQPSYQACRLADVRRFAAWWRATDPRTEVPPQGLLPQRFHRKPPFIYSDAQVANLLAAARTLASRRGVRGLTYGTLFGLIAVTGMRMSEAVALDSGDVDLAQGLVTIRRTKFGKTRVVPIHSSASAELRSYSVARDHLLRTTTPAFFLSERGTRITAWSTEYNFACASRRSGLRPPVEGYRHGRGPRIHDLRHRFAVKTLIAWYRAGLDAERELPKLSAYLGHVHVNDTYWYLEAVPELLRLATERLERRSSEVPR